MNRFGFRTAVGPKIGGRCLLSGMPDFDLRGSMEHGEGDAQGSFSFLHADEVELLDWDDREQLEILAVRL